MNVQCPHCHNYKVQQQVHWYSYPKRRWVRRSGWTSCGYALFAIPAIFAGAFFVGTFCVFFFFPPLRDDGYKIGYCIFPLLGAALTLPIVEYMRLRDMQEATRILRLQCDTCGYRWEMQSSVS